MKLPPLSTLLLAITVCLSAEPSPVAAVPAMTATEILANASTATPKAPPISLGAAPLLPSLADGGFTAEPAFLEEFNPGALSKSASWRVATWKQNGTQMSPQRARVNADGHLVQTVLAGEPLRGASIQSVQEFPYGRWLVRARPSSVPGLLNSIFTKDWDNLSTSESDRDGSMGEVDIEFVTHTFGPGRGEVHLAIHLKDHHPLFDVDVPLDFNPSDDFNVWGFDILPDRVVWHVNGRVLHVWRYTAEHRIEPNYEFFFNSWTMKKWLKGPPAADADYHVDWVRFHPLATRAK